MPERIADREVGQAPVPTLEDARRLAEWRPPLGVISVFLRFDPADRGGGWRTELRNGVNAVLDAADALEHDTRTALRATAERVVERFVNHERSLPRGEIGFVEVAPHPSRQHWWQSHISPDGGATVRFEMEPMVAPLVCVAERSGARGVAIVSAERVRLLEWRSGRLELLEAWELSVFSRDWRERKAQRVADPARAQGVSASGRDQYDERLAENRQHFLGECRRLALGVATRRGWSELLAFGAGQHVEVFAEGGESSSTPIAIASDADLISTPSGELERHVGKAVEAADRQREHDLVHRALEEARGGRRGTAGPQETLVALDEGRVEHLIVDADLAIRSSSIERYVRRALASAADISTVSGEAAELLSEVEGVAALLRY
jgi:hypothetical protein